MDRVVLVKPNGNYTYNKELHNLKAIELPLWHLILAKNYNTVALIDAEADNLNEKETIEQILSHNPNKVVILATGSHPSAFIQQKELSLKLELILTGKVNVENYSNLPINPILFGEPRWDLVDINKYRAHNWHSWGYETRIPYGAIYTSISCPFHCNFCTIHNFYQQPYEERPIEDIMKDLDWMDKNKVVHIKIMDELFIFRPQRVMEICDEIIKKEYKFNIWAYARIDIMNEDLLKKMKQAGINWLAYGIETGNDEIRKNVLKGSFNKNKIREIIKMTKDNGINCLGNYMFGFWEDTWDTMKETLDFAKELNCEYSNFYCLTAYPGTIFYEELKEKGIELPSNFLEYAQMSEDFKPLPTKELEGKDILKFRDMSFLSYYASQKYLTMMLIKFGSSVVQEIGAMCAIKLKRKHVRS